MESQNFFSSHFGKKTQREKKMQTVYFQRKINTENFPNLQKNLQTFFNDYSKYFQTTFEDNNRIVVGKKYSRNKRSKGKNSLTESWSPKSKNKRFLKRPTIRRFVSVRSDSLNRSKMNNDDKKKSFEENNLKPGQRFIDDREIDKLFNLYKELRKINKERNYNFMNMQELKELKEAQNEKSGENFFKNNNSTNFDKRLFYNSEEKKTGSSLMRTITFDVNKMRKNNLDINNESEYNGTISTNVGNTMNTMQEEFSKNINYKSIESEKEEKKKYSFNADEINKRKKLIAKQNQYLYKNIQLALKNQFAETLALQENVFLCQNKNNKFQKNFKNYLNRRFKRQQDSRLLIQDDSHRKILELKMKIDFFQKKLNPDKIYDWYYDLHSSRSSFPLLDKKIETIRNPKNLKDYDDKISKSLDKDNYLKNNITSKYFHNLEKDVNNADNNYGGLIVEGKNLLEFENNMAKRLKGKKILNDFERLLSPSKLKNENIYSNIVNKLK